MGAALSPKDATRVFCHVTQGLACLHAARQVHGAIRPARVWLTQSGSARLSTFPLARDPLAVVGVRVSLDVEPEAADYCPPESTTARGADRRRRHL